MREPVASTMRNSTPRMALIRVNIICPDDVAHAGTRDSGHRWPCPSATRVATSAPVRPAMRSVAPGSRSSRKAHRVKVPIRSSSKYSNVSRSPSKAAFDTLPAARFLT